MNNSSTEKADVLFIYPPLHRLYGERKQWMPLSIICLASYLTQNGINAKAYNADCDLTEPEKVMSYTERFESGRFFLENLQGNNYIWEEMKTVLKEISPKIIGISILTEALGSVKKSLEIIREILPDAIIIGGGPHAEIDAEYLIDEMQFDYVVKGDGEETLREICSSILYESKNVYKPSIIKSKRIEIYQLPIPKLETHYRYELYRKVGRKMNITTSRGGCPFSCSFCYCSKYKYSLRFQSPERVIEEIQHHIDSYGTRKVFFVDDTFTVNKQYVSRICDLIIQNKINFSWTCTTRAGQIDKELLFKMKQSGCNSIHLGIESGSTRILTLLNKRIDFNMVEESVDLIKKSEIDCRMFFMAGLPTESSNDLQKSIDCIRRFKPDETILDIYVPIPGTPLYDFICNMGVPLHSIDWCSFSREKVPYKRYVDDSDGRYDLKLRELFHSVEEMNARSPANKSQALK